MATGGDAKITVRQLCELVGITHQARQKWQNKGLVACLPTGARLVDALELRAFVEVNQALRPSDAVIAWTQVQPELKTRIPSAEVDVVFDLQIRLARVADSADHLAELVRVPHPIRVIRLGPALLEMRKSFDTLATPLATPYPKASGKSGKPESDEKSA